MSELRTGEGVGGPLFQGPPPAAAGTTPKLGGRFSISRQAPDDDTTPKTAQTARQAVKTIRDGVRSVLAAPLWQGIESTEPGKIGEFISGKQEEIKKLRAQLETARKQLTDEESTLSRGEYA